MEREVGRHSPHHHHIHTPGPHPDWSQVSGAGGRGRWAVRLEPVEPGGNRLGGGELAPPQEGGRGEAASDLRPAACLELTSGEENVWLLQMKGQRCFGVL